MKPGDIALVLDEIPNDGQDGIPKFFSQGETFIVTKTEMLEFGQLGLYGGRYDFPINEGRCVLSTTHHNPYTKIQARDMAQSL